MLFIEINLKLEPCVVLNCDAQEQAKRKMGNRNSGRWKSKGKEDKGERRSSQLKENQTVL